MSSECFSSQHNDIHLTFQHFPLVHVCVCVRCLRGVCPQSVQKVTWPHGATHIKWVSVQHGKQPSRVCVRSRWSDGVMCSKVETHLNNGSAISEKDPWTIRGCESEAEISTTHAHTNIFHSETTYSMRRNVMSYWILSTQNWLDHEKWAFLQYWNQSQYKFAVEQLY